MQKQEEKKNRGAKPTTNHQQRLENIVRQTTVEARVRRHNHAFIWVSGGWGGVGGLHSNRIQMVQENRMARSVSSVSGARAQQLCRGPQRLAGTLFILQGAERRPARSHWASALTGASWEMRLMENTCRPLDCSPSLTLFSGTDGSWLTRSASVSPAARGGFLRSSRGPQTSESAAIL